MIIPTRKPSPANSEYSKKAPNPTEKIALIIFPHHAHFYGHT